MPEKLPTNAHKCIALAVPRVICRSCGYIFFSGSQLAQASTLACKDIDASIRMHVCFCLSVRPLHVRIGIHITYVYTYIYNMSVHVPICVNTAYTCMHTWIVIVHHTTSRSAGSASRIFVLRSCWLFENSKPGQRVERAPPPPRVRGRARRSPWQSSFPDSKPCCCGHASSAVPLSACLCF